MTTPLRIVFLGSGAFGLPTLGRLGDEHEVVLVVSRPDRAAGRHRKLAPTPIAAFAEASGIPTIKPESPNRPEVLERISEVRPDALVVIAYGHKLGEALLEDRFAINLHASLLPKYRGAAPINWAMINGDTETGVSVITLAQTMDAGLVLARRSMAIDPREIAGELHDRLAALGPEIVLETLRRHAAGTLDGDAQDPALVTQAPKLRKSDGTVHFDQPAAAVRARVHGLTPWPGCRVRLGDQTIHLLRVEDAGEEPVTAAPGAIVGEDLVACAPGAVRILLVKPPGGRSMTFEAFRRGHPVPDGARLESL